MKEDAGKFSRNSLEMENLLTGYHDSAMSLLYLFIFLKIMLLSFFFLKMLHI